MPEVKVNLTDKEIFFLLKTTRAPSVSEAVKVAVESLIKAGEVQKNSKDSKAFREEVVKNFASLFRETVLKELKEFYSKEERKRLLSLEAKVLELEKELENIKRSLRSSGKETQFFVPLSQTGKKLMKELAGVFAKDGIVLRTLTKIEPTEDLVEFLFSLESRNGRIIMELPDVEERLKELKPFCNGQRVSCKVSYAGEGKYLLVLKKD